MTNAETVKAEMQASIADEWRRFYAFLALGFTVEQAQALATAGYDVLGYSPLPLSALTGVQG